MNECNWHLNELKKRNNLINHVHGHRKPKAEMKGDFYYGANNDNNEKITNWIAVFLSLHFGQRSRCIFSWFCTLYCLVKVKAISFSFSILAVRRFVSVFFVFIEKICCCHCCYTVAATVTISTSSTFSSSSSSFSASTCTVIVIATVTDRVLPVDFLHRIFMFYPNVTFNAIAVCLYFVTLYFNGHLFW